MKRFQVLFSDISTTFFSMPVFLITKTSFTFSSPILYPEDLSPVVIIILPRFKNVQIQLTFNIMLASGIQCSD